MHCRAILALIVAETKSQVGLHGVEAVVLQPIRSYLVGEADTAPLLPHIKEDARLHLAYRPQRGF